MLLQTQFLSLPQTKIAELVNIGYAGVCIIAISTAGGIGVQDLEICDGLNHIFRFLKDLHQGKYLIPFPICPPLPLLSKSSIEQIEEEGGSEEIDAQLINNRQNGYIKYEANMAKSEILNHFIYRSDKEPERF
ncbi:MAG: hypothetical protein EZS28_002172 [Streblomastix strix]|uniref:Uncharacterized protein n=1 Tax=Streblomastix strix TaxID=222440 RepID=A0A5J4X4Y2_9EUKA|nr:MAG: hypothetical protein EZS28_002172 [Streblomastix strix]